MPILTYGCEIWGHYIVRKIELLHLKLLKHILSAHRYTRHSMTYGEFGIFPLYIYRKCKIIEYWSRKIWGEDTKLCWIMYQSLLHGCGMSWLWLLLELSNVTRCKTPVETRLKDQWRVFWRSNQSILSTCKNYSILKSAYCMEWYFIKLQKTNCILFTKNIFFLFFNVGR